MGCIVPNEITELEIIELGLRVCWSLFIENSGGVRQAVRRAAR